MGLELPDLDDREYDDLVEEAMKLIPAHSEEWTDFNPHDPGITTLELLAWLTESYTYQADQITDAHREKYLALMGERPRPPTAATVRLQLDPPRSAAGARIARGEEVVVSDGSGTRKLFGTVEDVVLTGASVTAVVTRHDRGLTDNTHANETEGMFYRAFGDDAGEDSALYLGFDADPFRAAREFAVAVGYYEGNLPPVGDHGGEESTFEPSVETVWEYCTNYWEHEDEDAWEPLTVTADGTDDMYHSGTVAFERPEEWTPQRWGMEDAGVVGHDPGLVWFRCRVERPGHEIPPQVDWVRTNVVAARNAAAVTDERLEEVRSPSDGPNLNGRTYRFEHSPILDADVAVGGERWTEVEDFDASGPTDRHYVLDRSEGRVTFGDGVRGRTPDPEAEVVAERYVLGGGEDGNVPKDSTWQFIRTDAKVSDGVVLDDVGVGAAEAGSGGSDGESVDEAFRRVREEMRTPYRAVTPEDYRELALSTPGIRVGRSTVLVGESGPGSPRSTGNGAGPPPGAGRGPDPRRAGAGTDSGPAGPATVDGADGAAVPAEDPEQRLPEVTVVVVPYSPADVGKPEPSEGFLTAVRDHLDRHRLLTDRVRVEPPNYVGLRLNVEVRATGMRSELQRQSEVASAVAEYVDPIHGYEGDGWPFGRNLSTEELRALINDVGWVEGVRRVSVDTRGEAVVDPDGNVIVNEASLFYLDELSLDRARSARRRPGD